MASLSSSLHLVKSTFVFKFLWLTVQHEGDKVIVFERAVLPRLIYSHTSRTFFGYSISTLQIGILLPVMEINDAVLRITEWVLNSLENIELCLTRMKRYLMDKAESILQGDISQLTSVGTTDPIFCRVINPRNQWSVLTFSVYSFTCSYYSGKGGLSLHGWHLFLLCHYKKQIVDREL